MSKLRSLLELDRDEIAQLIAWFIIIRLLAAACFLLAWTIFYLTYFHFLLNYWPVFSICLAEIIVCLPYYIWLRAKRSLAWLAIGQLWLDSLAIILAIHQISDSQSLINSLFFIPIILASLLSVRASMITAVFIALVYLSSLYLELIGYLPINPERTYLTFPARLIQPAFLLIILFLSSQILFYYNRNIKRKAGALAESRSEIGRLRQQLEKKLEETNAELYQRNKELKESEARFRQTAELAEEWIWEVDAAGRYNYSNQVVEKILGYKPEELVGKKYFYDLFAPEGKEELTQAALSAFSSQESFRKFVNPNLHKNGSLVYLETSGSPVMDSNGKVLGYRGLDTDITEYKQANDALAKHAAELEKMNKFMIGRELDMINLKKEINRLLVELGRPAKYQVN
ncbi:MAG: PAS domain S-box protein [Candidatus Saganbacteria bacterium]|nr:PAS domain S-box protein [Candidatus Saganbacteria bacterium]